jgi:hypothetical protein
MSDLKQLLQEYVEENIERIEADDVLAAVSRTRTGSPPRASLRPAWAFVLGAVAVLVLGGATWLIRSEFRANDVVSQPEVPVEIGEWNPILSTARAGPSPAAATCPPGSNPDAPGSVDQPRPWGANWSNQAAVFDQHAGRIVYVDEAGDTWTFNVCTNTWSEMNPRFMNDDASTWMGRDGWPGQLVYDVDSDRTIAFGGNHLGVYDANFNTWTVRSLPTDYAVAEPGSGVVYDPVSGLVVIRFSPGLVAYDVDTDTWIPVETVGNRPYPPFLVGYVPETDRFVFLDGFDGEGLIVDPRTGRSEDLKGPEGGVFAGFGSLDYATSASGAYVLDKGGDICRLDPTTLEWGCISGPDPNSGDAGLLGAIVADPINHRIVLIYGYGPGFNGERFYDVNPIWAIDFPTRDWTQLLAATGAMTLEQDE